MNSKSMANDTPKFVAKYIENFIDLVENVPNDLSRRVSLIHEIQLEYETSLSKLETSLTKFSQNKDKDDCKQLKSLLAIQNYLAKMQELSDNKLALVQNALDLLDEKSRELDVDFKMINGPETPGTSSSPATSKTTTSRTQTRCASNPPTSPEPTYCVCRQISFGDMICCDNKNCEIEWFHFQCVSLISKPKGKWYCPDCRGKNPNQPKDKPTKGKLIDCPPVKSV